MKVVVQKGNGWDTVDLPVEELLELNKRKGTDYEERIGKLERAVSLMQMLMQNKTTENAIEKRVEQEMAQEAPKLMLRFRNKQNRQTALVDYITKNPGSTVAEINDELYKKNGYISVFATTTDLVEVVSDKRVTYLLSRGKRKYFNPQALMQFEQKDFKNLRLNKQRIRKDILPRYVDYLRAGAPTDKKIKTSNDSWLPFVDAIIRRLRGQPDPRVVSVRKTKEHATEEPKTEEKTQDKITDALDLIKDKAKKLNIQLTDSAALELTKTPKWNEVLQHAAWEKNYYLALDGVRYFLQRLNKQETAQTETQPEGDKSFKAPPEMVKLYGNGTCDAILDFIAHQNPKKLLTYQDFTNFCNGLEQREVASVWGTWFVPNFHWLLKKAVVVAGAPRLVNKYELRW